MVSQDLPSTTKSFQMVDMVDPNVTCHVIQCGYMCRVILPVKSSYLLIYIVECI